MKKQTSFQAYRWIVYAVLLLSYVMVNFHKMSLGAVKEDLTYLFGMPSEVHSFTGKVSQLDIDSNDYAVYIARYGNERICELHLDYFGRKSMRTIALFTDTDTIIGDLLAGTVSWTKSGKVIDFGGERDAYQTRELEFFLDAVTSGDKLQEELPHAVKVLKLTQGILEK